MQSLKRVVLALLGMVGIGLFTILAFRGQESPFRQGDDNNGRDYEQRMDGQVHEEKQMNASAKAELGRHAWYLFHTVLSRFPEHPSGTERQDLVRYMTYFAQFYPCAECGRHFEQVLIQHPVQSSGRIPAAMWGCAVHNIVNVRLKKPEYNCATVLEDYDCGCGVASSGNSTAEA